MKCQAIDEQVNEIWYIHLKVLFSNKKCKIKIPAIT